MSHALTLSAAVGTITVPDDGDDLEAASVETPFQTVGNWLQWTYDQLTGAAPIVANLDIDGSVDIQDLLSIGGYGASAIEALGDINTQGAMYAQNGALFDDTVEITAGGLKTDTIEASGAAVVGGLTTAGFVIATSGLNTSGLVGCLGVSAGTSGVATTGTLAASRGYKYRIFDGPNSDTTIIGANYDLVVAVLGASRTYTLSTSGAETGMVIRFKNDTPASFNLNIEAGSEDSVVAPGEVVEYYYKSGAWHVLKKW